MAADPFTALGIASNVIQFVDFTWKLVIGSRTIYQSSEGASENNLVLRVILADVSRLSHKISTSGDDSSLDDLARECKTIATRLIELLQQLTVKGKRTKWRCFAVAMKEVWSKAEIDELSSRLARLQNQLTLNLQWLVVQVPVLFMSYYRLLSHFIRLTGPWTQEPGLANGQIHPGYPRYLSQSRSEAKGRYRRP